MNYRMNIWAGGIFSKYIIVLQNLARLQFDDYCINIIDKRTNPNMFDYIFEQNLNQTFSLFECIPFEPYTKTSRIELSSKYIDYKNIVNKKKFKKKIKDKVEELTIKYQISEKTCGVHIRLTDMNIHHREDFGVSAIEDYLSKLNQDDDYFVASDNEESLKKLQDKFGEKIKFIPNLIRGKTETEDTFQLQIDNFKNPIFWEESFVEMLLLSKCGSLICNTSNLSNASVIHSDTIANIIRI